ncbi:hypothetical protein Bca52824_023526 [Brassica carinata]|uniref:Uncharacterized protein n=1 Tax=Brassica carinata TaxID=52824 RepID=A0A8X7VID4_BRACI|nr:hypothetical protein Bca52824_023526 [Brassica carinata]
MSLEFSAIRDGHARAIDGRIHQVSREDIADILQVVNGPENLFMQQRSIPNTARVTSGILIKGCAPEVKVSGDAPEVLRTRDGDGGRCCSEPESHGRRRRRRGSWKSWKGACLLHQRLNPMDEGEEEPWLDGQKMKKTRRRRRSGILIKGCAPEVKVSGDAPEVLRTRDGDGGRCCSEPESHGRRRRRRGVMEVLEGSMSSLHQRLNPMDEGEEEPWLDGQKMKKTRRRRRWMCG